MGLFFFYTELTTRFIVPATIVGIIIYYPLWRIVSKFELSRGRSLLIFPPVLAGLIFVAAMTLERVPGFVEILAVLALFLCAVYVVGLTVWVTSRVVRKFDRSRWWLAPILGLFVLAPFLGQAYAVGSLGYVILVWSLALSRGTRPSPPPSRWARA